MKKILLTLLIFTFTAGAAPLRFDFVFADPVTNAETTGFIVLETDLIANPGFNEINLPSPAVLDLQITVSGSAVSDGNYDINDYELVLFGTNGGTLNFNQPLIGQATNDDPWGTNIDEGNSGEFNLISSGFQSNIEEFYNNFIPSGIIGDAPTGCWYFTLCEQQGGKGDSNGGTQGGPLFAEMESFNPVAPQGTPVSVPSLSFWAMVLMTLALITTVMVKRKKTSLI